LSAEARSAKAIVLVYNPFRKFRTRNKMNALMVVDVQKAMFASGRTPHDGLAVVARIAQLLARVRQSETAVFHVQHDGGPGDEFCRGERGFEICDAVAPLAGEPVFVKTKHSAFAGTGLENALRLAGIDHIVLTGMQTEFCINTTLLGAVDRGFRMTVARDGHTTLDNEILPATKIIELHHRIWQPKMADLVPAAEIEF
jgi:nicotinamidase-related amidase